MPNFLLDRFTTQGTLPDPKGVPDPAYSLPGSLNWMRALAILVEDEGVNVAKMQGVCTTVPKMTLTDQAVNTTFEQLLMSLHHLASLKTMAGLPIKIDTSRSAIVTWYYGIFHAASAMIAAQTGSFQDSHTETANSWDRQFSGRPYIPKVFSYRVTSLVKKVVDAEISTLRGANTFALINEPRDAIEAFGACMSYLNGSAAWRREYIENDLINKELKNLGLTNFRTNKAQGIRDARLTGKSFGFVHQASRYRGKASYREALFISYGSHVEPSLINFYSDLFTVLEAFLCLAGNFSARRIGKNLWNDMIDDVDLNVPLAVKTPSVWAKI